MFMCLSANLFLWGFSKSCYDFVIHSFPFLVVVMNITLNS